MRMSSGGVPDLSCEVTETKQEGRGGFPLKNGSATLRKTLLDLRRPLFQSVPCILFQLFRNPKRQPTRRSG